MSTTRLAALSPFTKRFVNPLTRHVAGFLPGFAIVITVGRRSGLVRRIPMNVFRVHGDYVFALTYGSGVDWVKNVQAAGGCALQTRGRRVELREPVVFTDPTRKLVPWPVRTFLGVMRVTEFLRMRPIEV